MLMPCDLPDPAGYDVTEIAGWPELQARLEAQITHYEGEIGAKFFAHHTRVAADGLGFLLHLNYPMETAMNLRSALLFHDIGKTHPSYDPLIWTLPTRPSEDQRAEKRLHTRRGLEMFNTYIEDKPFAGHPHINVCRAVILYHHERLNGSKYENRTDLPEWLQAVCIVDTFDGDRMQRPHQDHRRSMEETIERMMCAKDHGKKYEGAFDRYLLEKFAEYKI